MAEVVEEGPRPGPSWQRLSKTWHSGADLASELTPGEIRQLESTVERISGFLDGRGVEHEFACEIAPDPEYGDWTFVSITVRMALGADEMHDILEGPVDGIVAESQPRGCGPTIVFLCEGLHRE